VQGRDLLERNDKKSLSPGNGKRGLASLLWRAVL
jgi:hypothetical protein